MVVRFSITVTDSKFRFSVKLLTWGHLSVRLGTSRFVDVEPTGFELRGRSLRIGAHNHEYAEAYYFGNPGQYQHFVLSSNELGTGDFWYSIRQEGGPSFTCSGVLEADHQVPVGKRQEFDPEAGYARKFRAATTINTLTVLGPAGNSEPGKLAEPRGPDSLHVRVLVPGRRVRREIQRRVRRINAPPRAGTKRSTPLAVLQAVRTVRTGATANDGLKAPGQLLAPVRAREDMHIAAENDHDLADPCLPILEPGSGQLPGRRVLP